MLGIADVKEVIFLELNIKNEVVGYEYFDKIIKHLNRKKCKPDYGTNDEAVKPRWEIDSRTSIDDKWYMLVVYYNYYYMTITYRPYKQNPYEIYIDLENCSTRDGCSLYCKSWHDVWYAQEDVIEYIRYKLR
jgi:hypothetical protein